MSSSNPSHLLISRNPPRSPAHPQLAPASTSRHATSAGGAGSSPLPSPRPNAGFLGRWHHSADELSPLPFYHSRTTSTPGGTGIDNIDGDDQGFLRQKERNEDGHLEIHHTFLPDSQMPGKVKVIVGHSEFWCHKEVLWFASPFFQGLLQGNWAETTRDLSPSAVESSPPPVHVPSSPPTDTDPTFESGSGATKHVPDWSDQQGHGHIAGSFHPRDSLPTTYANIPIQSAGLEQGGLFRASEEEGSSEEHHWIETSRSNEDSRKTSLYLDAEDHDRDHDDNGPGPSVAEILRELRELPETPAVGIQTRTIADVLDDVPPPLPLTLGEVEPRNETSLQMPRARRPIPIPALFKGDESYHSPHRQHNQGQGQQRAPRARIRHSFSSITAVKSAIPRSYSNAEEVEGIVTAEAVVELHEESAAAFQDFLFWAYPHLECKVSWTNVEDLLALACKLIVPALQRICEHFLMTHASGRPVMTLMLAEQHCNGELFREASRFVLDQPTWDQDEMDVLSEQTQLKLSKRRNWFLERLLKLGSIDVKKEYTCRADCPDPTRCQNSLDEKWRQAHIAVSRYGPPQPSVAFRCLRQLETFPTNPSLVMPHPLCQSAAKSWVMSLFDRMFQPKLVSTNPGTEKYWLWISMD